MNHKAMRPDIDRLSELYGEGFLRSKFGLGESGLRRVWQKVEPNFTRDFADVFTSDLNLDQIFLMTLQHLREYKNVSALAQEWGIRQSLCSDLVWMATCTIRSALCKEYTFPRPLEQLKTKWSGTLGFRWVGAIDCRWLRRQRPHPGQKDAYRYDKRCHGLSASLLVDTDGTENQ